SSQTLFSPRRSRAHRALHPFPTRRSSDLILREPAREYRADPVELAIPDRAQRLGIAQPRQPLGRDHQRLTPAVLALGMCDHERRSEEHTSELQSRENLVCRLLLEKKNRSA